MPAAADPLEAPGPPSLTPKTVICGGGICGAAVAYYLAERGLSSTIVERTGVACAASGKAGGFLADNWEGPTPRGELQTQSYALHKQLAAALGAEKIGYRPVTTFSGASKSSSGGSNEEHPWLTSGVSDLKELGSMENTAQVHPEKLTLALVEAAEQMAGTAVRKGKVEGLFLADDGRSVAGVLVDGQEVPADVVVLAMGPWTGLASSWRSGIPAIRGQIGHSLIYKSPEDIPAHCLYLHHDHRDRGGSAEVDVFTRPDGTIYCIGQSYFAEPPEDPAAVHPQASDIARLKAAGPAISAALAPERVVREQACYRPISPDGNPVIGAVPDCSGLYVASGHSCWGILEAPATGKVMAQLILDGHASLLDIAPFSPARFN